MRPGSGNISYVPGKMNTLKAPPITDPKLKAILDKATEAADTFLNAIADMQERLSFKAFTLGGGLTREQKNSLLDLLMTQIAIRIKEMGPEVMEEKTITSSVDEGSEENDDFVLWLHATNEKPAPPTKEEPFPHFDPKAEVIVPKLTVVSEDDNGPLEVVLEPAPMA